MKNISFKSILDFLKNNFIDEQNISRTITLNIILLALLAALRENPPEPFKIVLLLTEIALAIQVTRIYATIVEQRIRQKKEAEPMTINRIRDELENFIKSVAIPDFFLLLAGFGLIPLGLAFRLASYILLMILFVYGYLAGRYSGRNKFISTLYGFGILLIGLSIVFIRSLT